MPLTLLRDHQADVIESGFILDRRRHAVIESHPYTDFLNKHTHRTDLFLYHHLEYLNYVLCSWLHKPLSCIELTCFDTPPGHFDTDAPALAVVRDIVQPHREKAAKALRAQQERNAAKKASLIESALERADLARYARQRGLQGTAVQLEGGCSFGGSEDQRRAVTDHLTVATKMSNRSSGPSYDHLKPSVPAHLKGRTFEITRN